MLQLVTLLRAVAPDPSVLLSKPLALLQALLYTLSANGSLALL